jgi:hypothetical protein
MAFMVILVRVLSAGSSNEGSPMEMVETRVGEEQLFPLDMA